MSDIKAQVILATSPLLWSNGDTFNGFLLLGLGLPTGSVAVSKVGVHVNGVFVQSPTAIWHRIIDGLLDGFYIQRNDKLTPPGTRWYAYFYDLSNRLVAPAVATAAAINVNNTTVTITPPTLTIPTASSVSPTFISGGDIK